MSDANDEDLAADVDELADALRDLREELAPRRRGPFGLPAPPSPGELLRFADDQAIPFAIAVLEANVRALELLQGAIRLAESGREASAEARRAQGRAASLGRSTLERLDDVLSDLETAASEGALPRQPEAREVLEEARQLRDEVDDALAARIDEAPAGEDDAADDATVIDVGETPTDGGQPQDADQAPAVDVEGELRSIKEELGKLEDRTDSGTEEDTDGTDGDDGAGGAATGDESDGGDGPDEDR